MLGPGRATTFTVLQPHAPHVSALVAGRLPAGASPAGCAERLNPGLQRGRTKMRMLMPVHCWNRVLQPDRTSMPRYLHNDSGHRFASGSRQGRAVHC